MRFDLTKEQEEYREELCQFLSRELTPEVFREYEDPLERGGLQWQWVKAFRKRLAKSGYLSAGWPSEYGGGGKDAIYHVLFHEEYDYHGGPELGLGYRLLVPAIVLLCTEEQKRFFMPKLVEGEVDFFLGYTEPEAGSDLANLQTRAILEGDEFVVNGQKLFSSEAQHSDYGWVAVRTDPDAPKHKGISLLIVDMKSPGISLGQYTTMAGWLHPSVYFDNVRVPRSNLVGEMNQGWYHIMAALDIERAVGGNRGRGMRHFDMLLDYCRKEQRNGSPLVNDSHVRNQLAELETEVHASRLLAFWVASMHINGQHPQHETSLASILYRETHRRIQATHLDIMGPYAQLTLKSEWAPLDGVIEHAYKNDTPLLFAAGGLDITRNIIARRGLGLPSK